MTKYTVKPADRINRLYGKRPDMFCIHCRRYVGNCDCTYDPEYVRPRDWREHQRPRSKAGRIMPNAAECTWRHSHWRARRDKVAKALLNSKIAGKQFENFCACGAGQVVQWSEKLQRHRISGSFCKNRHCEPCQRAKAARIRQNLEKQLEEAVSSSPRNKRTHRFVTFTLRHTNEPLKQQIEKLYRSFKKIRREKCWAESQTGGVVMLEVKLSEGNWHPHLHVISAGNYMAQDELREAWHRITGDSFIVDIRALNRSKDVGIYIAKYVTKGTSVAVWEDDSKASEWIAAIKGVRTCSTYGDWRGMQLTAPLETADDWILVDALDKLIGRARSDEAHAIQILLTLRPPGDEAEESTIAQ